MRILHLDAGREMRGGQWQVVRLIEGLAGAGVESTLLARTGAPLAVAARERGWRVEPLGFARAVLLARRHDWSTPTMHAPIRSAPSCAARRWWWRGGSLSRSARAGSTRARGTTWRFPNSSSGC